MISIRFLIVVSILVVSFVVAFKWTSELDEVGNKLLYRVCFAMFLARTFSTLLFHEALGLFPQ